MNRELITTAMEVAGAGCLVAGLWLLFGVAVGLLTAGVVLIVGGYLWAAA